MGVRLTMAIFDPCSLCKILKRRRWCPIYMHPVAFNKTMYIFQRTPWNPIGSTDIPTFPKDPVSTYH